MPRQDGPVDPDDPTNALDNARDSAQQSSSISGSNGALDDAALAEVSVSRRAAGGAASGGRGMRIGSVAGIPVYVSAMWFLVALLTVVVYGGVVQQTLPSLSGAMPYLVAALFAVLLFGSVFLHELAHALVSKAFGLHVYAMSLWMLGGVTETEAESKRPGVDFLIAFVGPVVNLVIGAAAVAGSMVTAPETVARVLLYQLAISNLLVGVFNLLPGLPLDGGTMLKALVWGVTASKYWGTVVAGWIGRVVAVCIVLFTLFGAQSGALGISAGLLLTLAIAWFLWNGATQSLRFAKVSRRFGALHAGRMALPATLVAADLPLAEALRQNVELNGMDGQPPSVVVVDSDGRPEGVVSQEAVAATPADRRPWVPVTAAARTLHPGLVLPADLAGEDVVRAVQENPATEYVVVDAGGGRVVGVLPAAAIADVLRQREPSR